MWRYISTPPHVLMIKGLNFYFQALHNKTPNVLEPTPLPNDISLDNAGLIVKQTGRLVFCSQDKLENREVLM